MSATDGTSSGMGLRSLVTTIGNIVTAINSLATTIGQIFPKANSTTASTATAGTSGAPPAQVAGYLNVTVNGTPVKVPYFNP